MHPPAWTRLSIGAAAMAIVATLVSPTTATGSIAPPPARSREPVERPVVRIEAPGIGQAFPPGPVAMSGTATSDRRITGVEIAIRDRRTGRWWHPNGSWGGRRWVPATLSDGVAARVSWRFLWSEAPLGRFALRVRAIDDGGVGPRSSGRRFRVSRPAMASFLTILFSRTQWKTSPGCRDVEGAVPLDQVARDLAARGLVATGTVVIDRTSETDVPVCVGQSLSATWDQIATLRDRYGWTFVSAGISYRDLTALPEPEQRRESCGSLEAMREHGHPRAWGLFAYPNNRWDASIQRRVVSRCFAFGRRYGQGLTEAAASRTPWFQSTFSVNGGTCASPGSTCADPATVGTTYAYTPPGALAEALAASPATWRSVQLYRFVSGARAAQPAWDCTNTDPSLHWTGAPEIYCYIDFLAVLDGLPSGVRVVDPATVARAWGRERVGG